MTNPTNPKIQIRLLGEFRVTVDGQRVPALENARLQTLLAYLVLHAGESLKRSRIAFTFWPESEEKQALANFRNLLHKLRQALPQIDSCLTTDSKTITWKLDSNYTLDVSEFKQATRFEPEPIEGNSQKAIKHLRETAALYKGNLLPDCYDDWVSNDRERLLLSAKKNLTTLVAKLKESGDYTNAIKYCSTLIQYDELREPSHYALIELHALNRDRASALQAYKQCDALLQKELEISPGAELKALYQHIKEGRFEKKTDEPIESHAPQSPQPPKHKTRFLYLASVLLATALVLAISLLVFENKISPEPTGKSIAILPFENHRGHEEDLFFTDGIHDDLINRISQIEDLKVISRSSVMNYRDSSIPVEAIAKDLGVATIIEGGVQRSGDVIRINIQLIDAGTGYHIWAEDYTRKTTAENIFALQSEITDAIANQLQTALKPDTAKLAKQIPTKNIDALESYFYGKSSGSNSTSEGLEKAINHYKRSIELDPHFAEAHAALALSYLSQIHFSGKSVEAQIAIAQSHIAKALELNNNLSDAYVSLGKLQYRKTNYIDSEQAFLTAIKLDPNNALAYSTYSGLMHYKFGDYDKALELSQKARDLAPKDIAPRLEQSSILVSLARAEEAKQILLGLIKEDPQNATVIGRLAWLYDESLNQYDQAIKLYRQAIALDPSNQNLPFRLAWAYFHLGDRENFIYWSERNIQVAPNSYKASLLRGFVHEFRGNTEKALASFSDLKKSDVFYDWSTYKIAAASVAAGRYREAIELFTVFYPWITNPDCAINNSNCVQVIDYVYLLSLNDRQEESRSLGDRVIAFLPQATRLSPTGYKFFDTPLYIARGDTEGALSAIRDYVDLGGCSSYLARETFIQSLHPEPEFKRLLDIVESRLSKQRQQLAEWEANGTLAPIPELSLILKTQ
ncbi:tetratricopeptide repeat protein [Puniceicoccaceae bacterium K14]|nr:tetratricopeptide repeat protein [Puniceicoccaceae bacterium K14]